MTAIILMVLALLMVGKRIGRNSGRESTVGGQEIRDSSAVHQRRVMSGEKGERSHRQATGRAARGEVAPGGVNGQWGLVTLENLRGRPESGDEAYVARLGPEGGLMKVESIEGGAAILSVETLDMKELLEEDRIETMPPRSPGK